MVILGGDQPRRRALEDQQLVDRGGDLGNELHGAGAGPDHGHPLAPEIHIVAPAGRVERNALERLAPRDRGERRAVQLADRADDRLCLERLLALRRAQAQRPRAALLAPLGRRDLGLEADVLAQPEAIGAGPEVVEQHLLRGVVLRPVLALGERVAVEVVGHVDAAARIGVLPPRAAHVGILLEDHERHARLLEPVGGHDAGHAGADHRHLEGRVGRQLSEAPARRPEVVAVHRELLEEQGEIVLDHLVPHDEGEDPAHGVLIGFGRRHAASVPEPCQRLEGQMPGQLQAVAVDPAVGLEQPGRVRP